ncbi:MAG: DUF4330 family protein [Ruminococcaceae bacterium]|nr:DUF4330 family protein [Oscillospiraceae bacterium]
MNRTKNEAQRPEAEERKPRKRRAPEKEPQGADRKKWLFLVVDILLLAAIVAVVIVLISLLTPWSIFDNSTTEPRQITYTVEIKGVDQASLSALQVGDTVTDRTTGVTIGTVTAIHNRDFEDYASEAGEWDEELGAYVVDKVIYPEDSGLMTVTVTLTVTADYEAGVGYCVGNSRIAVGCVLDMAFNNYADIGECVALEAK